MLAPHISEDIGRRLNNIRRALVPRLRLLIYRLKYNIHFPKIKNVFLTLIFFEQNQLSARKVVAVWHAVQKVLSPQITYGRRTWLAPRDAALIQR